MNKNKCFIFNFISVKAIEDNLKTDMEKRYLGIKELAEYLGIKEGTLYVWTCYKKIPYFKIGRCVKFDLKEIESWVKDKRVEELS